MFRLLKRAVDNFRGAGDASVAIPVFDGPLKPNNDLDHAQILAEGGGFNDIAPDGMGGVYAARSTELVKIDSHGKLESLENFHVPIQALCRSDDTLAIAMGARVVLRGGAYGEVEVNACNGVPFKSLNAVAFDGHGILYISQGSSAHSGDCWKRDLMTRGATGRIVKYSLETREAATAIDGLEYCYGVCPSGSQVLVSESWAHRIVDVASGKAVPVLSDLPGYPAHIVPAGQGGYWLSLFAKRTQLIELVLRARTYREAMIRSIPPDYWIAPSLRSGKDFLEPLQFGAVRQMGIFKPWAPTNSYGVTIRLNKDCNPVYACHSRAGGENHGTVGAVESGESLIVLSKGSDRILKLPISKVHDQN